MSERPRGGPSTYRGGGGGGGGGGGDQVCRGTKRGGAFWMLTYNNHLGIMQYIYIYSKIRFDSSIFLGCIFKISSTAMS